ncbi:MAG TPA: tetratricopeptide repeat protein [Bryobacteraceae bacterium]|nr:tetratricopeptide repeat protein [Bryobacteraceae bacterium]
MTRIRVPVFCSALLCGLLWAQQTPSQKDPQAPPEEDEELQPAKEYTFNPLQAEKELKVGNFYFKKGSYKAAASRYREATRWNSGFAEAYLRLGDAEEKRKDLKAAQEAYAKFLELAPADKRAAEVKKKLEAKR